MSAAAVRPAVTISGPLLAALGLLSAALLLYEIELMRRLLIERWHHFGFLVISVALLGFGASGTLLALLGSWGRRNAYGILIVAGSAFALALIVMPRLAALLPATAAFIPADLWSQTGWWSLYWLCAFIPFLAGATFIGMTLTVAGERVGRAYAANLVGSGAGAAAAVLLAAQLPPRFGLWPALALALVALVLLWRGAGAALAQRRGAAVLAALVAVSAVAAEISWPVVLDYDEHKYAAYLQRLIEQGSAERLAARPDPHGYVELYASPLFHDLPFLALTQTPPALDRLLVHGDPAGSVLRVERAADAGVMDGTLMAVPYRLLPARPRVLLLGESGGANAWLALRREAAQVDWVQRNAAVLGLIRAHAPALAAQPRLALHAADARRFVAARSGATYDLIQIVSLEGLGGAAGVRGLAEDHLATIQGFADCLRALRPEGLLAVSRGIQQPPRENVRILATLAAALETLGVAAPARHIVQVRDYLGVCTLALRSPLTPERRALLEETIEALNLTPVWYAGLPPERVNQPDALPGPSGTEVDWLHHAAREILVGQREAFFDRWLFDVRPCPDDSPFFWDFYRAEALPVLQQAYGDLWLTRAELSRLFLYAALIIAAGAGILLILAPLGVSEGVRFILRRRVSRAGGALADERGPRLEGSGTPRPRGALAAGAFAIIYFTAIGLGFMGVEMALISRAIRHLGDPVLASALVIGGVLLLSGLGSLSAVRVAGGWPWLPALLAAAGAVLLRLTAWGETWMLPLLVSLPLAWLMGMALPLGLRRLDQALPRLVPWAWGMNGVASVVATSAAILVAMEKGYSTVMFLGAAAYMLAGFMFLLSTPALGGVRSISAPPGAKRTA